jgi:hypothetical protein
MIRVVATLTVIFFVLYAGVRWGYDRLEKELRNGSCCTGTPLKNELSVADKQPQTKTQAKTIPKQTNVSLNKKKPSPRLDTQIIIRRNIFQVVFEPTVAPPVKEVKKAMAGAVAVAVPTKLNLTLAGTVIGSEETSRAIIIDNSKREQKLYQQGDAVQGAIIESIERGQVTLDVNGVMETLLMKKRKGGGPGAPVPSSLRNRINRTPRRSPRIPTADLEMDEDDAVEPIEQKRVRRVSRPPRARPRRRVNIRRKPSRVEAGMEEDTQYDGPPVDVELPPHED